MAKQQLNLNQTKNTYTASEQDTGKVWVDGRTIYRTTIRGTFSVAASSNNVAHSISGLTSSMELISLGGGIKLGASGVAGGQMQSFHYREAGGNWIHLNAVDGTNVVIQSSFAWGTSWITVVMEYVK